MGTDGARTVVVNSLGREIRTLDEVEPIEGRRLKLTIDYDVQKAAEDGFRALGFWGAAAALDPRTGEVLSLVSLPSYDPNSFADRHRSRDVDRAQHRQAASAAEPRHPGAILAGLDLQDCRRGRGPRGGRRDAGLQGALLGRRNLLRPLLQVPPQGRPRHRGHAARDREVVQRLLLHAGQHARRGPDPQVGDAARARREVGHRPAQRDRGHHAVHRVEAEAQQREVVRGRDHLGGDRPGAGLGDADLAGRDDGDGGQRRHAVRAAAGQGLRRRAGVEGSRSAAGARDVPVQAVDLQRRARRAVDGRQRARHRRARPHSRPGRRRARPARRR